MNIQCMNCEYGNRCTNCMYNDEQKKRDLEQEQKKRYSESLRKNSHFCMAIPRITHTIRGQRGLIRRI